MGGGAAETYRDEEAPVLHSPSEVGYQHGAPIKVEFLQIPPIFNLA